MQGHHYAGRPSVWSDDYGHVRTHSRHGHGYPFSSHAAADQVVTQDRLHLKVFNFAVHAFDFLGDVTAKVTDVIQQRSPQSNRIAVELCVRVGTGLLLLGLARSFMSVIVTVGGLAVLALCSNAAIHFSTAMSEANKDFRTSARARRRNVRYQPQYQYQQHQQYQQQEQHTGPTARSYVHRARTMNPRPTPRTYAQPRQSARPPSPGPVIDVWYTME